MSSHTELRLSALGLRASYGATPILDGVSLELRAGELVALLGPNGSGKSTLVRVLAGTLAPSHGEVRLQGRLLGTLSRKDIAARLAVVPQDSQPALGFTVAEVVAMGRAPHQSGLMLGSDADHRAVDEALRRCELSELAHRPVHALSGGERQRVALARALAQAPRVLLLDEPGSHLDLRHAVALYRLLRALTRDEGLACLAVVHDLAAAARWADRVVVLERGRVVANGPPADVLTAELLSAVFGVPLRRGIDEPSGSPYFVVET